MKDIFFLTIIFMLQSCGKTPSESKTTDLYDGSSAAFKGYNMISSVLNERLFTQPEALDLSVFLDPPNSVVGSLTEFLGIYKSTGDRSVMVNAKPNSLNMFLWATALDGLSLKLAEICSKDVLRDESGIKLTKLKPAAREILMSLCGEQNKNNKNLNELWNLLVFFDATDAERQAWVEFSQTKIEPRARDATANLREIIMAALFNPFFLLIR